MDEPVSKKDKRLRTALLFIAFGPGLIGPVLYFRDTEPLSVGWTLIFATICGIGGMVIGVVGGHKEGIGAAVFFIVWEVLASAGIVAIRMLVK